MSQILVLVRKSILNFRRARAAIAITFIVPIVLIYIFGHVFGLYRKPGSPDGIPVAVINQSADPAAAELVAALKAEKTLAILTDRKLPDGTRRPLTEEDARRAMHDNDYRFALILPPDMVSADRIGIRLKVLTNPRNEMEAQIVNGMLQKTIFSKVPQLMGQSLQRSARNHLGDERFTQFNRGVADNVARAFGGDPAEIEKRMAAGDFFGAARVESAENASSASAGSAASTAGSNRSDDLLARLVQVDTEQIAGKEVKNPMAARIVSGYAIMFLLFAVSGSAASMFEEKASGIFQRLLSAPVTAAHIVWARFIFGVLLGLVQIGALFVAGRVFFGLDITSHMGALLAVTIAAAAACSAFGVLIAAVSPSAEAAQGLSTFVVISMSALGGAWFPVSAMPAYIQIVSKFTIVYWSVEGLTDVLWAGYPLANVLPKVGVLAAIAAVVMLFSLWRFTRNRFFQG